jgi:hypothetical protein
MEQLAKSEVARQVRECVVLSQNLRTQAVTSLFGLGAIWYDSNGDPLPSSSTAVTTIDPSIPANNRNQLNGLISASWATAGTPIIEDLMNIQKQCLVNSAGRTGPITHAVYGADLGKYFYSNTQVAAAMTSNPYLQAAFAQGVIPQGFAGIKNWWPGNFGFYANASGTTVTPFAADCLALFPEPDPSWYELQEGIEPVPSGALTSASTLDELASKIGIQSGMFTYAVPTFDPIGGKMVFGDNFLPAIHIPEVVFIADVVA